MGRASMSWASSDSTPFGDTTSLLSKGHDEVLSGTDNAVKDIEEARKCRVDEDISQAALLANAHDFISELPDGYDTDVGSNGAALSGGQKQRIAIARALIKRPAVLLLDEATSALDSASERLVQESIDQLQASKMQTTIVIAHRLSTIKNADKIVVVDKGSVAEMGTHNELLESNGLYSRLVAQQLDGNADNTLPPPLETSCENEVTTINSDLGSIDIQTIIEVAIERSCSAATEQLVKVPASKKTPLEVSESEKALINSKIWNMIRSQPVYLGLGLLGAAVFGSVFSVWGFLIGISQNMFYMSPDRLRRESSEIALYYIALSVISLMASVAQYGCIGHIGCNITLHLRSEFFESLIRRDISFFDMAENSSGTLTTRLANDSTTVAKATGEALAKKIQGAFVLVIGLGIALAASWKIALVYVATFPLNVIAAMIGMQEMSGIRTYVAV